MKYAIIDIEGIGEAYAAEFQEVGINTAEELLARGATAAGRAQVAEITGISPKLILKWVNHADLFRITGVGPQFAELLEAAGVDTVKELRHRNAANLAEKLAEVNYEKHLTRRVPAESELQRMIDEAKVIDPLITY